jgi:hypothetical protein
VPTSIYVLAGKNYSVNQGYFPITNAGGGTLQWTATSQNPSLITMVTTSGQTSWYGTIAFDLNVSSRNAGNYVGTVEIDGGTAGTSIVTVNVKLVDVLQKIFLPFIIH